MARATEQLAQEKADENLRGQGDPQQGGAEQVGVGLIRALGGALLFSLPTLMTQEMWNLGFYMGRTRLALFIAVGFPLLVSLAHYAGFQRTFNLMEEIRAAFIGYLLALMVAAGVLYTIGVIGPGMPASEILGKIALQAVPGAIGALLARSQLGGSPPLDEEQKRQEAGFGGELLIMALGALVLSFNIAPTEEVLIISQLLTGWHAVALVILSIAIMHAFVYVANFRGQAHVPPGTPVWSELLRFTIVGYALVIGISLYVLWSFGRLDGMALPEVLAMGVVLGLPSAIGAAAARLIL